MRALHTIRCIQLRSSLRDPKNKMKALEVPFQSEGQRLYGLFRRVSRLLSRFLTWWKLAGQSISRTTGLAGGKLGRK